MKNSWRGDKKLTAMMVEDMLFDPILASKVLLRVKLPPHEEIRLTWMWSTYYTSDDSGFSSGKSWTFALVSALRSILLPNRVSGIVSKTFSQGKLIFQNYERWYSSSPIFRSCIQHTGTKSRLLHGTDVWQAYFRGGSEIRVLPPNFFQDAERLRSERWNDAYLDEWTTYGNFNVLKKTIIGRVNKANDFRDCPVRQNHIHLGSTPTSKHKPAYALVKTINKHIAQGNQDYGRLTSSWRHIPDTPEWEFLVNNKILFTMQTSLPKDVIRSEVDGFWSDDRNAYYNGSLVDQVRTNQSIELKRSDSSAIYIAAFDTAPGGEDQTGSESDDFSLSVVKIGNESPVPRHVFTYRHNGLTDVQMAGFIHKMNMEFGFSLIVCDPNGGGLFVKDKLRNETQIIDGVQVICTPIITPTDTSGTEGQQILCMFSRGDFMVKQAFHGMASDSVLVNQLHKDMKGVIENNSIQLIKQWDGWDGKGMKDYDADSKREWLNQNTHLSFAERVFAESDLAICQLSLVDIKRNNLTGMPLVDSFGMYKFGSRAKKDSAYSLCYANFGIKVYQQLDGVFFSTDSMSGESRFASSLAPI